MVAERKMKQERKQNVFKAIRTVIFVWIDTYPEDFDEPPNYPCLTSIKTFAKTHMHSTDIADRAQRCLYNYTGQGDEAGPIVGASVVSCHLWC